MYKRASIGSLAFLIFAVAGYFFAHGFRPAPPPANAVAEIVNLRGTVRTRNSVSLSWDKAYKHQYLLPDDAVYAAAGGQARVILKHGSVLELSENSLLEISAREIPRLQTGNVRLSLQGDIKFNLAGYPLNLHGQDSELQLYIEEPNLARLRLLSGSARLNRPVRPFDLEKAKVASPERPDVHAGTDPILNAKAGVEAQQTGNEYFFTERMNDVYQRTVSGGWILRPSPDPMVETPVFLRWKLSGLPQGIKVELAQSRRFEKALSWTIESTELRLQKVFRGDNYWRVTANGHDWSDAYFRTSPLPKPGEPPWLRMSQRTFKAGRAGRFPVESQAPYKAIVVEVAPRPDFQPAQTEVTWITDGVYLFARPKAGDYFLRVRGVNAKDEVSDYSQFQKITVEN